VDDDQTIEQGAVLSAGPGSDERIDRAARDGQERHGEDQGAAAGDPESAGGPRD
jgi:hypothetical protein